MIKRSLFLALLAGVGLAGPLAGECAYYVTTQFFDDPDSGYLIGVEHHSRTGSFTGKSGVADARFEETVEWDVGYYRMSNGRIGMFDCRTYRFVGWA